MLTCNTASTRSLPYSQCFKSITFQVITFQAFHRFSLELPLWPGLSLVGPRWRIAFLFLTRISSSRPGSLGLASQTPSTSCMIIHVYTCVTAWNNAALA